MLNRSANAWLQADVVDIAQEGTQALHTLKELPPRAVFQDMFAVKAQASLSAAAAVAGSAVDNGVLLSGVREVQQLTNAALSHPLLSKHQLTKVCQVCLTFTLLRYLGSVMLADSGSHDLGLSMTGLPSAIPIGRGLCLAGCLHIWGH